VGARLLDAVAEGRRVGLRSPDSDHDPHPARSVCPSRRGGHTEVARLIDLFQLPFRE
jgi:hypothetical protein